ncbi:MAG TPA: hypothetical protein PLH32_18120 [bacterium]|nr:hypothetical protein [bacterium]
MAKNILQKIGMLSADAPVIRRKVGETLTAALRIDTGGLSVHSAGCDVVYPAVLKYRSSVAGEVWTRVGVNNYPASNLAYVAAEQDGNALTGDLPLASVVFDCIAPGEGLVLSTANRKAILRGDDNTYKLHPTAGEDGAFAVDPAEPDVPDGAVVMFKIIVTELL